MHINLSDFYNSLRGNGRQDYLNLACVIGCIPIYAVFRTSCKVIGNGEGKEHFNPTSVISCILIYKTFRTFLEVIGNDRGEEYFIGVIGCMPIYVVFRTSWEEVVIRGRKRAF